MNVGSEMKINIELQHHHQQQHQYRVVSYGLIYQLRLWVIFVRNLPLKEEAAAQDLYKNKKLMFNAKHHQQFIIICIFCKFANQIV
jgi:hypothetical protein